MKKYSYTNKLKNVSSATEHPENEKLDLFQNAMIYLDVKTFSNVMRAIDYTLELRKKVSTSFFLDVTKKQFENKIMEKIDQLSSLPPKELDEMMKSFNDSRKFDTLEDIEKNNKELFKVWDSLLIENVFFVELLVTITFVETDLWDDVMSMIEFSKQLKYSNKLEEAHQKHNKEINEMMKKMRENPDEYEQTEFENKIMDHVNMHSYLPIDSRTHKKLNDLMKNEEFPKLTD